MTAYERLIEWHTEKVKEAKDSGKEMFLGLPDEWYEPPHWACENGHISTMYLKSEVKGCLCLECRSPLVLCPEMTDEELKAQLSSE